MKHCRSKSANSCFLRSLNGSTLPNLRADCLSLFHALPHPQLNLMPQSSQLQDSGREVRHKCVIKINNFLLKFIFGGWGEYLWLTSSSLVRSNSRPLSLNMATWWGPSLSVTWTKKMSIVMSSSALLINRSTTTLQFPPRKHQHFLTVVNKIILDYRLATWESQTSKSSIKKIIRQTSTSLTQHTLTGERVIISPEPLGKILAWAIISSTLVLPALWSPTTTT